ncbi:MAG: hypothetical protein OXG10_07770 [Candidatus Dadabacteria bacterium]|nr:hypothetical protein [Candidatus Dadabacteria bacterium]
MKKECSSTKTSQKENLQKYKPAEENRKSWVTDIELEEKNLMKIMRAGRARWRIENETFNTLKNQEYHFEHNFGHENKHLSGVFGNLLLAFLIDQIEMRCCGLFLCALEKMERLKCLRNKVRSMFMEHVLESWEFLYRAIKVTEAV